MQVERHEMSTIATVGIEAGYLHRKESLILSYYFTVFPSTLVGYILLYIERWARTHTKRRTTKGLFVDSNLFYKRTQSYSSLFSPSSLRWPQFSS